MGETVPPKTPSFNGPVRVQLSGQHSTRDAGALTLREALDSSGVMPPWKIFGAIPVTRLGPAIRWPASCVPWCGWVDLSDRLRCATTRSDIWKVAMPAA